MKYWYRGLTPEEKQAKQDYQKAHRQARPDQYYWARIKSVYKLSPADFRALLQRQGGRCAICRTAEPGGRSGKWCVDHDHTCCSGTNSCGKCVRGLLCTHCNHGLGNFRDDPEALRASADYLERFREHD